MFRPTPCRAPLCRSRTPSRGRVTTRVPRGCVALLLVLSLGLAACATLVESELLSPEIDFSTFRSFNWIDPADTPYAEAFAQNPLVDKRIHLTIDEQLILKGYPKVEPEKASFLVTYHVAATERVEFYAVGGARTVQAEPYFDTAIMLDVYEASSKQLAWRGLVRKAFDNREAAIESIRGSVQMIVEKFVSDTAR